jgi:hypothetical protein
MDELSNIFLGVLSGVITSVILLIAGKFTVKVFIPWYQEIIYKGVDLQGRWTNTSQHDNTVNYTYQIDIKQSAHKLNGSAVITKSGSNKDYIQDFTLEGETWEGYVTINLRSKNRENLSFVAGLFKVEGRGQILDGSWAYRATTDKVDSESLKLNRS